jgi:hypothetical protein
VTRTKNRWIQYNCEEDNGREPFSNSVKCEIAMRPESLDPEDTWQEINISLTENSREGGSLTFEVAKHEIKI